MPTAGQITTGTKAPKVGPDPKPVEPRPATTLPALLAPTGVLYILNPMARLWAVYESIQAYNQRLALPEYTTRVPDMCENVSIELNTLKVVQ